MLFETAQVLEIAGIGKDTLRHWRDKLPPLKEVDGRSRRYTLAELVAICVIACTTQKLGMNISHLRESADWLFTEVADRLSSTAEDGIVCFHSDGTATWADVIPTEVDCITAVRVRPILERIRRAPHESIKKRQLTLPFQ